MYRTVHLGGDFLNVEHISSFATGDGIAMNNIDVEERIIRMLGDGRVLYRLSATFLISKRFGKHMKMQSNGYGGRYRGDGR